MHDNLRILKANYSIPTISIYLLLTTGLIIGLNNQELLDQAPYWGRGIFYIAIMAFTIGFVAELVVIIKQANNLYERISKSGLPTQVMLRLSEMFYTNSTKTIETLYKDLSLGNPLSTYWITTELKAVYGDRVHVNQRTLPSEYRGLGTHEIEIKFSGNNHHLDVEFIVEGSYLVAFKTKCTIFKECSISNHMALDTTGTRVRLLSPNLKKTLQPFRHGDYQDKFRIYNLQDYVDLMTTKSDVGDLNYLLLDLSDQINNNVI